MKDMKEHMNTFEFQGSTTLPKVKLDPNKGLLEISGKSVPENSVSLYDDIIQWVNQYEQAESKSTTLVLNFDYFNIFTSKKLLNIIYKLNEMFKTGKDVRIVWLYKEGDDDMYEVGLDLSCMVNVPFEFIPFFKEVKETLEVKKKLVLEEVAR